MQHQMPRAAGMGRPRPRSFALATFGGLLLLHDGHRAPAACAFAAGTCLRSNGVANAGYLLFDALCRSARRRRLPPLLAGAALACLVAAPAILHELRAYARYCTGGGDQLTGLPVWCNRTVPSLYGHVQREHWKNGFLAYWELKQLPNFALAAPAVSVLLGGAVSYARAVHAAGWRAFLSDGGMGSVAVLPHVVKDGAWWRISGYPGSLLHECAGGHPVLFRRVPKLPLVARHGVAGPRLGRGRQGLPGIICLPRDPAAPELPPLDMTRHRATIRALCEGSLEEHTSSVANRGGLGCRLISVFS
ncbi:unnamed protein product, partial [Prorocentrum cordatum]